MVSVLNSVHKAIFPYFLFYADPLHKTLNFEGFSKFCGDFEIFPKLISKPQLMRIFMSMS